MKQFPQYEIGETNSLEQMDMKRLMDIDALQMGTFVYVAEAGSFNQAAKNTFITPAALMKRINLLEERMGVKLFQRTNHGLVLTTAGKYFYQDAKNIIKLIEDSAIRAKHAAQDHISVIRIGISSLLPAQMLGEIWQEVCAACPKNSRFQMIPFDYRPDTMQTMMKELGKNLDLLFWFVDDVITERYQCRGIELFRSAAGCAVSFHHPLAAKDELEIEDLYGETVMLMRWGATRMENAVRDDLTRNHPRVRITDLAYYNEDAFNLCEREGSIMIVDQSLQPVYPFLKFIPVKWPYAVHLGLLYANNPSENVRGFLDVVEGIVQRRNLSLTEVF